MAVRVKSNKKRKYAGNRSFGGGNAKNRRGKGNRGGVGRAGFHKHNWLRTIKMGETNKRDRGEHGFRHFSNKLKEISVEMLCSQAAAGKYPQKDGFYVIELKGFKVLSNGVASLKLDVKASAFTKPAIEKIKAAGGKAEALEKTGQTPTPVKKAEAEKK